MEEAILFNFWTFEYTLPGETRPRAWKLERAKPPMKAAYGKHLEGLMLDGINRHRDRLDAVAYKTAMGEWSRGFLVGDFVWRGELFWATLNAPENMLELAWHWIQQSEVNLPPREQLTFGQFRDMWAATIKDKGPDGKDRERKVSTILGDKLIEMVTEKNPTLAPA